MARGRKKEWKEVMVARFPEETFDKIQLVLKEEEDRTELVREAVAREIDRRYRILRKSSTEVAIVDGKEVPVVSRFVDPKPFKSTVPEGVSFTFTDRFPASTRDLDGSDDEDDE